MLYSEGIIDAMILPPMRRSWRWRQLCLRAKIDEAVFSSRDARTPAAMPAYAELVNIYHAEKQVERPSRNGRDTSLSNSSFPTNHANFGIFRFYLRIMRVPVGICNLTFEKRQG